MSPRRGWVVLWRWRVLQICRAYGAPEACLGSRRGNEADVLRPWTHESATSRRRLPLSMRVQNIPARRPTSPGAESNSPVGHSNAGIFRPKRAFAKSIPPAGHSNARTGGSNTGNARSKAPGGESLSRSVLSNAPVRQSNSRFAPSNRSSVPNCPASGRSGGSKSRFCRSSVLSGRSSVSFRDAIWRGGRSTVRFRRSSVPFLVSAVLWECSIHEFPCSTVLFPCSTASFRDTGAEVARWLSRFGTKMGQWEVARSDIRLLTLTTVQPESCS